MLCSCSRRTKRIIPGRSSRAGHQRQPFSILLLGQLLGALRGALRPKEVSRGRLTSPFMQLSRPETPGVCAGEQVWGGGQYGAPHEPTSLSLSTASWRDHQKQNSPPEIREHKSANHWQTLSHVGKENLTQAWPIPIPLHTLTSVFLLSIFRPLPWGF